MGFNNLQFKNNCRLGCVSRAVASRLKELSPSVHPLLDSLEYHGQFWAPPYQKDKLEQIHSGHQNGPGA